MQCATARESSGAQLITNFIGRLPLFYNLKTEFHDEF